MDVKLILGKRGREPTEDQRADSRGASAITGMRFGGGPSPLTWSADAQREGARPANLAR
jgi:hypothetical protein